MIFRKDAWFVDLYVRVSNTVAICMYKSLGYIVYRTVLEYYSGDPDEDAYGIYVTFVKSIFRNNVLISVFFFRYEESAF